MRTAVIWNIMTKKIAGFSGEWSCFISEICKIYILKGFLNSKFNFYWINKWKLNIYHSLLITFKYRVYMSGNLSSRPIPCIFTRNSGSITPLVLANSKFLVIWSSYFSQLLGHIFRFRTVSKSIAKFLFKAVKSNITMGLI